MLLLFTYNRTPAPQQTPAQLSSAGHNADMRGCSTTPRSAHRGTVLHSTARRGTPRHSAHL